MQMNCFVWHMPLLRELKIKYNRARQAAITQEITEVCSGAKAQRAKKDANK